MPQSVRVVYYTPADRVRGLDVADRLDRVMTNIQNFYEEEMDKNGFGKITFPLERDTHGRLLVHFVSGTIPMSGWNRGAFDQLKAEIRSSRNRGEHEVDFDRETVVVISDLLCWNGRRSVEIGPYAGGGGVKYGLSPDCWTAWTIDDPRLDADCLRSNELGSWYDQAACTWGEFNSHYIGGIAHELGHAFGLPHDAETTKERSTRGTSLMGSGNHVYGREKRGNELGAFLTRASAAPLAVHPLFTGVPRYMGAIDWILIEQNARCIERAIQLNGRVVGSCATTGVIAYNADASIGDDYHAVGWVTETDANGRFSIEIPVQASGNYWIRLRAYGPAGMLKLAYWTYTVDSRMTPRVTGAVVKSEPS